MKLKDKNLYYVGGFVRDKLLGLKNKDIDYCYEGDAIDFALNNNFDVLKSNNNLRTVRIKINAEEIDIASTRSEAYEKKGHLPKLVKCGCPLKEDLIRRDFTINAMAIRTTDNEIIDCFNGQNDLNNKLLRVLHDKSFIDDPTRIIRGLKFSVRFGFELEEHTRKLQEEYLANINYDMSYFRLKKELVDAFSMNKKEVFERFVSQKMYRLLGDNQSLPEVNPEIIEDLVNKYPSKCPWLLYLGVFDLSNLPLERAEKRIVEWVERLKTQKPTNNTPFESLLIGKYLGLNTDMHERCRCLTEF